jgi:hypothetical protein
MSKSKLPQGVTEAQVQEWKDKHSKVKLISCKRENGEQVEYIIGQPTRDILDSWSHYMSNDNNKKAREILQTNCILFGEKSLFEKDVNLESTVTKKITEMLETLRTEEKEL